MLFTGYAPVHFACFQPVFERLVAEGVDVKLSGGTRTMGPFGVRYDHDLMYGSFGLSGDHIVPFDEARVMDVDVLFSAHTGRLAPERVGRSIQIFHGMSFRNMAIREAADGFDHYFVIGPYMRRGFETRGVFAPGDPRVVEVGFPKTDALLNGSLNREQVLAELGLTGERPVVLYAPTGASGNSLPTMGEELVRRLRAEDGYDVLVKLHDHPKGYFDGFAVIDPLVGEHVKLLRVADVIPCLFVADLLITDASSVANEYALLDRPIVFLDVPDLIASARESGAAVDLDTWGRKGGEVVADPVEAVAAVAAGVSNPSQRSAVRNEMVDDLFYHPGKATDAAIAFLADEFGL